MDYKLSKSSTKFRYGMSNPDQLEQWLEEAKPIGVGFIGRSNVGKSSTINALFGKNTANTSKTPGRTREINIFSFGLELDGKPVEGTREFWLFDLPGYGHAKVSKEMSAQWERLMHTFFVGSSESVLMLNLQDARHPNQKSDLAFRGYLEPFNFNTFMVFNKMDKLKKQKERAQLEKLKPQIFKEASWVQQIHFISAESKKGVPQLEKAIIDHLLLQNEIKNKSE
jgi:GTP-binding protein